MSKKITRPDLARDVLSWLGPRSKVNLDPEFGSIFLAAPDDQEEDVRRLLLSGKPCTVCGIGALAAALAYRVDQLKLNRWWNGRSCVTHRGSVHRFLSPYFSPSQLDLIEDAFERGKGVPTRVIVQNSATSTLCWIMRNIVRNRGRFVPSAHH